MAYIYIMKKVYKSLVVFRVVVLSIFMLFVFSSSLTAGEKNLRFFVEKISGGGEVVFLLSPNSDIYFYPIKRVEMMMMMKLYTSTEVGIGRNGGWGPGWSSRLLTPQLLKKGEEFRYSVNLHKEFKGLVNYSSSCMILFWDAPVFFKQDKATKIEVEYFSGGKRFNCNKSNQAIK